jgi:integrase
MEKGNQTHKGIKIRSRGKSWQVDFGTIQGERRQRSYKTRKEALLAIDAHVERLKIHEANQRSRRIGLYDLTEQESIDIITSLDKLGGKHTLNEAVDFFLEYSRPQGQTRTVPQLLDEYVQDRKDAERRPRSIKDIENNLKSFADAFRDKSAHLISTEDLKDWMRSRNGGAVTKGNRRRHLSGLFTFAIKHGYSRENPAAALTTPTVTKDRRPTVLSVADVRNLMVASASVLVPGSNSMVPYFALCVFAGLRPESEAQSINWSEVDLDRGEVFILAEISKTGTERYVTLQPNLIEWLIPHRRRTGRIFWTRHFYDKVRKEAGVQWGHDITRHSFGTYHLAAFRNAGDTAEQMGHESSTNMLFKHYRRAVRQEEAQQFWNIRPDIEGKMISMAG